MRRRIRRLSEADWRALDGLLVAVLLVGGGVDVVTSDARSGPLAVDAALVAAMAIPLLWRRRRPLAVLGAVGACALVGHLVVTPLPDMLVPVAILIVAVYSTAVHLERRPALIGLAAGVGLVAAIALIYDPNDVAFPVAVFGVAPWLAGRAIRNQTLLARELAEQADRAEHDRELEERRLIAAERARVARELHDVLAHNLSVMVIQASAAGRVVEDDPDRAAEAAALIRRTGRETLTELRHMFGPVLKEDAEALDGAPGLARVDRLAERARTAGLPVEVCVEGTPVPLGPGADIAAYRVVQEGLTNALKHSGGARARVRIRYEPSEVAIEVVDEGAGENGDASAVEGAGHGLMGMRERVAIHGGRLEAGRQPDGGFAVRARLPAERAAG